MAFVVVGVEGVEGALSWVSRLKLQIAVLHAGGTRQNLICTWISSLQSEELESRDYRPLGFRGMRLEGICSNLCETVTCGKA